MEYDNLSIYASPYFCNVKCPKHKIPMFEIDDGFLKKAWFCPKCKAPHTIGLIKMKRWNKKALNKALLDQRNDGLKK